MYKLCLVRKGKEKKIAKQSYGLLFVGYEELARLQKTEYLLLKRFYFEFFPDYSLLSLTDFRNDLLKKIWLLCSSSKQWAG